ncbi:MAG: carboxylesterase/lipase family protein [Porticoccaceae bacterium]
MNRILLTLVFLSIASCALFAPREPVIALLDKHKITTTSGTVQGQFADAISTSAVLNWLDIPYAQPPVGDLRWRAPRPLQTPKAVIETRGNIACVQPATEYGGASAENGESVVGSEDCLYLDISAPEDFADANYPVMFWIHGGGNTTGTKNYYDFSKLVESQKVIVVTINYRLGALGWFTHPAIQGMQAGVDGVDGLDQLDGASNFGTLDIIQALRWVQDNIGQFGGDASNVTIFGESAGGHNVYSLLASPLAKGLFHKAIAQSGYTISNSLEDAYNFKAANSYVTRGAWQVVEDLLVRQQGSSQQSYSKEELHRLLKYVDAREFIALYNKTDKIDYIPLTTADGIVIPKQGLLAAMADPKYAKNIPVISGANKDEVTLWLGLHRYFINVGYPLTRLLPARMTIKDPQLYSFWVRIRSQAWKARGVDEPLDALELAGYDNLYAYRFDWDDQKTSFFADFPNIIGAAHGTDISFVTGDFKYGPITSYIYPEGAERDQMQRTVMNIWGDFALSATPDKSLPFQWQAYNSADKAYVHLDKDEFLALDFETETLDSLLASVASFSDASYAEKCILVWETLINIGDADIARYNSWNNGQCANFDARAEQNKIAEKLIEKYGSPSVI